MKKNFGILVALAILAVGCGEDEPSGDIAPPGVKIERAGTGTGPQPSAGVGAPAPQPAAGKAQTE